MGVCVVYASQYISTTPHSTILYTHPTAGLDLMDFAPMFTQFQSSQGDVARRTMMIRRFIQPMQDSFSAIERVCVCVCVCVCACACACACVCVCVCVCVAIAIFPPLSLFVSLVCLWLSLSFHPSIGEYLSPLSLHLSLSLSLFTDNIILLPLPPSLLTSSPPPPPLFSLSLTHTSPHPLPLLCSA